MAQSLIAATNVVDLSPCALALARCGIVLVILLFIQYKSKCQLFDWRCYILYFPVSMNYNLKPSSGYPVDNYLVVILF